LKILLDSHIWLWYLQGSLHLPKEIKNSLDDLDNILYLSPISLWELIILAEKKKISLLPDPFIWTKKYSSLDRFHEAPLNFSVAIKSRELNLQHKDPADRFILATAVVYGLTLATCDRQLIQAKEVPILF
jgi:PIN domain nuclease of toxin-antitoxin system